MVENKKINKKEMAMETKKKVDKVSLDKYCLLVESLGKEKVVEMGIEPKSEGSHLNQIEQAIAVNVKDPNFAELKKRLADRETDTKKINDLMKKCKITLAYKGGQGERAIPKFDNKIVVKPQQLDSKPAEKVSKS